VSTEPGQAQAITVNARVNERVNVHVAVNAHVNVKTF
jgi:hypothetical protein